MNGRWIISLALTILVTSAMTTLAQPVVITDAPSDYQLFPRDGQDSCAVTFSGIVHDPGYLTATLAIIKDQQVWRSFDQPLVYSDGEAEFSFAPNIHAELSNHRFVLQIDGFTIMEKHHIVCGDVIVLNGQSNTVAPGETDYESEWVRTFGTMSNDQLECYSDTTWDIAASDAVYAHAAVGVWGVVMGNRLSEYLGMPVAVMNGAIGATSIRNHQRNEIQPWNLRSIYGRLLYRMHKSGLHDHVRAIIWHQGESDTYPNDSQFYAERWDSLYHDWHDDYPALEHIYLFQVRNGLGDDQGGLREIQRQIPHNYDNIHIMSTAGLDEFDGLHYYDAGYEAFGELMWPLVARDLYGRPLPPHSEPPDIVQARYVTANQDQIALEFTDSVVWPADSLGEAMRQYFYLGDSWGMVESAFVYPQWDHVLLLNLSGPRVASTVSYLPDLDNHSGGIYYGPWVRNPNGIGALLFSDIPIQPAVDVFIEMLSPNPVHPGQDVDLNLHFTNHTGEPAERQIWAEATLPNGNRIMIIAPATMTIAANSSHVEQITHHLPNNLPAGEYEYTVSSGLYPNQVFSSDTIYVQVTP
jgi:Carbohydrate esterase, sialic acid-specific acetylesterase